MSYGEVLGVHHRLDVDVENVPAFTIDLGDAGNRWHRSHGKTPDIEPFKTQVFAKLLSDTPRVVDVGAYSGWFSCVASAVSQGRAQVMAFEAERTNFALLTRNVALNFFHNVWPRQMLLGAKDAVEKLIVNSHDIPDHRSSTVQGSETVDLAVCKLDTVLEHSAFVPDLLKISIDCSEARVIAGAERTIEKAGGGLAVFMGISTSPVGAEAAHDLADRIFSWGRPVFVLGDDQLQPLSAQALHGAIGGIADVAVGKHLDLLIAPGDDRLDALEPLIGADWQRGGAGVIRTWGA